ncbi:mitochondrial sodium/calcium exchanger protein isoform X2 [Drosophila ficusphila]|uniref:mitochondrial sodium/calcium exchanger protein isoform X2 n=1 Tax=Drosophila ficusphila TaxID=30025 RepID=UPI0007E6EE46|nr:mitochondrial sodium/calcium exchanger protein isoform X2 [Drosophila ficusphila]
MDINQNGQSDEVVPNAMDKQFENFWDNVSCFVANNFPFEERCAFVKKAKNCNSSTNLVPYMRLLACDLNCVNQFEQLVFLTFFVLLCFLILLLLINVCTNYYSPALKAVSMFLHMNEHLAGVTLLAFGNSSADLFSNLASVNADVPVVANSFAAALFVSMVSGGLICYMCPFKMNAYESARDILFLIFSLMVFEHFLESGSHLAEGEFISVNITDVYLIRRALKQTNAEIDAILDGKVTPAKRKRLQELEKLREAYSQNARVEIFERSSSGPTINKMRYTTRPMTLNTRISVDRRATRNVLYNRTRGPNWGLFSDFFVALRPITCVKWRKANMIERAMMVVQVPGVVICIVYIPLVDYELDKHGWNKLLNCIHVVLNPAMSIIVIKSLISCSREQLWYSSLGTEYIYGLYSLLITLPIALVMFRKSRTDLPPPYHWVFTIMNLTGSMFIIFVCATEIDKVLEVIGHTMHIEDDFMGATVKGCTGSLGPLIANIAMALHGYPRMGYASAIGGPFFTVIFSANTVLYVKRIFGFELMYENQMGNYGANAFTFLILGLFLILLWSTTLGFYARRSVGIYCIVFYCIYLLFAILINSRCIHSFTRDRPVHAAFGDV